MTAMRTAVQHAQPATETPLEIYYRRIIESQPVCLSRITSDGSFLAINDAALSLLGAEKHEQLLETSLLSMVSTDDKDQCRAFLSRITSGDRGSIEVDLTGLGGLRHTLQIHAVAIPGAIDAVPASFCTFRDITEHRRLERALMESAAREEEQVSALAAERERLNAALLETRNANVASATEAERARIAALEAALADVEKQHRDAGEQHASRQAQIITDFETAQQRFEGALTEQLQRIAEAEAAVHQAEARERELHERNVGNERAWKEQIAASAAEHERQSAALRESIAELEHSLAEATARERALVEARAAEEARWHSTLTDSTAKRDAELAALRETLAALETSTRKTEQARDAELTGLKDTVAALEQLIRDAEVARDEAIGRYDTDRAGWELRVVEAHQAGDERIAELEQVLRDAQHARDEAVSRYAADHAAWEQRLGAAHHAAEERLGSLQQELDTLETMQAGYLADKASLEQAVALADEARMQLSEQLAGLSVDRKALQAENRSLARHARSGRLALALASDLEIALATGVDRGRRLFESLPSTDPARPVIAEWLASTVQASAISRRIRREAQVTESAQAGQVVRSLEASLGAMLSPDVALSVLVGSHDANVDLTPEQVESLVITLTANRRTMMPGGGHASLEVADVDLDDTCGLERGASPGAYVLIALHVAGPGVQTGLPDELFAGPASADTWRMAGPGMAGVLQLAQSAGGHVWATREGADAVAFEVYLPRVERGPDEVTR
jgi:PAS domain S-box-containing protein